MQNIRSSKRKIFVKTTLILCNDSQLPIPVPKELGIEPHPLAKIFGQN